MLPKQQAYENLANTIIGKFNRRGIEGYYCSTREEALLMAERFLTPGCSVSWGGSVTLEEIGLIEALKASDYVLYDRKSAGSDEEYRELYGKIATCDNFFMSSNAITIDGELINIDGLGNRVACLIHGPANVIVVAGMNKVVTDVDGGVKRVRNIATPANTVRLSKNTPCATTGRCGNCLNDDTICAQIVITRKSMIPNRIKVILVGEELGF